MLRRLRIENLVLIREAELSFADANVELDTRATQMAALPSQQADELLALHEALQRLEQVDPRQSRIVECRFFGGMTVEETAAAVGVSVRTVKRDWAVKTSVPTPASHKPTNVVRMPLTTDLPVKKATIANPRTMSPKYSGGPKRSANFATGGAKNISPNTPKVPATKEEIAAIPRAAPARPWRAS